MSIEIWTGAAWAKGGWGGWAYAILGEAEPRGAAGGDRRTTPMRMALTVAVEALEAAGPGTDLVVYTPSADLAAGLAQALAAADEDKDLWERLAKQVGARTGKTEFRDRAAQKPDAAADFADGWANFALDIAKTKGLFASPIPKPNLKALLAKR